LQIIKNINVNEEKDKMGEIFKNQKKKWRQDSINALY
jgi:hypothetical protein